MPDFERNLLVAATAEVKSSIRDIAKLADEIGDAGDAAKDAAKGFDRIGKSATDIGGALTRGITLPLAAAGAAAATFAIKQQSAFAGVRKTIDTTEAGYQQIRGSLTQLSNEIPVSFAQLAGIGEIGGQLGIAEASIVDFTETIARLGEASDLTGEQGATALARFANVTKTAQGDIDRVASTIVALGNAGATTESEIANLATRFGAAGSLAGLSAPQILGFSQALSSVGVSAELGGTNFGKFTSELTKAVQTGGANLQQFAAVAGQTTGQFAQSFRDDAGQAILAFIQGLGQIQDSGGPTIQTLEEIGFTSTEMQRVLLSLTTNIGGLESALDLANKEFDENRALIEESNKRFATTESQLRILVNTVTNAAAAIGEKFRPAINDIAQSIIPVVVSIQEWVTGLGPLQTKLLLGATAVAGLAAAVGPLLVVGGQAVAAISTLSGAVATLPATAAAAAAGLRTFAASAVGATGSVSALSASLKTVGWAGFVAGALLAAKALLDLKDNQRQATIEAGKVKTNLLATRKELRALGAEVDKLPPLFGDSATFDAQIARLSKAAAEFGKTVDETGKLVDAQKDLSDETADATKDIDKLIKSISGLEDSTSDANRELKRFDLAASVRQAQELNRRLQDLSNQGFIQAQNSARTATTQLDGMRLGLEAVQRQAGTSAQEIISFSVATQTVVAPLSAAEAQTASYKAALDRLGVTSQETADRNLSELRAAVEAVRVEVEAGRAPMEDLKAAQEAYAQAAGGSVAPTRSFGDALKDVVQSGQRFFTDFLDKLATGQSPLQSIRSFFSEFRRQILSVVSEQVLGALIKGVSKFIDTIPGINNVTGAFQNFANALGGGGAGATSTLTSAFQSFGGAVSGVISTITGAISAVTDIIGVFQNARQNTLLYRIEEQQRRATQYLGDRGDGGITTSNLKILEQAGYITANTDEMKVALWSIQDSTEAAARSLESIARNGVPGGAGGGGGGTGGGGGGGGTTPSGPTEPQFPAGRSDPSLPSAPSRRTPPGRQDPNLPSAPTGPPQTPPGRQNPNLPTTPPVGRTTPAPLPPPPIPPRRRTVPLPSAPPEQPDSSSGSFGDIQVFVQTGPVTDAAFIRELTRQSQQAVAQAVRLRRG